MPPDCPQVAFNDWLSDAYDRIAAALNRDPSQEEFLARSVDHADLARRQRALEHARPLHLFW